MHLGLTHKTLSYADNAFVSLETIPMTTANLNVRWGKERSYMYGGLMYGRGDDTQSLPEFNQKFVVNAYGANAGFLVDF